ncbi:hypothetical protein [Ruegeria faecimaris]|uniref:hypothetical protein n=1 Tax=Ruegeria faecimaris TaxID=686389 RepID=UPI002330FD1C|nr:hypothetical protein [Ruegeria faecimaris]
MAQFGLLTRRLNAGLRLVRCRSAPRAEAKLDQSPGGRSGGRYRRSGAGTHVTARVYIGPDWVSVRVDETVTVAGIVNYDLGPLEIYPGALGGYVDHVRVPPRLTALSRMCEFGHPGMSHLQRMS